MTAENIHRLLKRQLRKHKISNEQLNEYSDFFKSINQAYKSFDTDIVHLENVLEVSSQELFVANEFLKQENKVKTDEALKAKQRLDRVLANITDVIFEVDSNGNFIYLNSAWILFAEEEPETAIGKNFMDYAETIKYFDKEVLNQINSRSFGDVKTVFSRLNKAGELIWWELSVGLKLDGNGEVTGAIGSLGDVTSAKRIEMELVAANESKSRFLSTMSHEIRTPLNAVIAISNILMMDEPKPSQVENLNALKFSSKHLLNLINDILDYNKLLSGKLRFNNEPFNLRQTIEGIVSAFQFNANDKGLVLDYNIGDGVPIGILGDNVRLSQILTNLLGNAIKFTSEGKVSLSINLVSEVADSVLLDFAVRDTGIGIDPEKFDLIFERFTQAEDSTTKNYGGTGLGLSICKKILTLLNSEIKVSSQLGEGTIFSFRLKYPKLENENIVAIDSRKDDVFNLDGIRLLVVDDNEMNLMVISQYFDSWNVEADEARNGLEAFEKVQERDYDIVLMDLQMPIMDGYEAARSIRSLGGKFQDLPIIALSASVSNDVIVKVTSNGMDDYLSKPFDPIDLYTKIRKSTYSRSMLALPKI